MTTTPDLLLAALRWRYATKKFDPTHRIPAETWDAIEASLVLTPSSFGLQPWKFLVVKNAGLRSQLLSESWGQPQVTDASHLVVLTARTDLNASDIESWMSCMASTQGTSPEGIAAYQGVIVGFAQAMSQEARHAWNVKQVYLALGQLMAAAAMIGVDSCPLEGISATAYDQILNLEGSGYATVVACALGYRAADDKYATLPKARFDRRHVIQHL